MSSSSRPVPRSLRMRRRSRIELSYAVPTVINSDCGIIIAISPSGDTAERGGGGRKRKIKTLFFWFVCDILIARRTNDHQHGATSHQASKQHRAAVTHFKALASQTGERAPTGTPPERPRHHQTTNKKKVHSYFSTKEIMSPMSLPSARGTYRRWARCKTQPARPRPRRRSQTRACSAWRRCLRARL